ncbi:MAG: hypothetical protein M5R40_04045 [Anaerolineae bacterium]|nr:hypothetical protein [Anaerolineae bacterium]
MTQAAAALRVGAGGLQQIGRDAQPRPGPDEDQPGHARGVVEGERQADRPAHAVPAEGRLRDAHRVEPLDEGRGIVRNRVAARRVGAPMPRQVRRERADSRQPAQRRGPIDVSAARPMHEHQRRAGRALPGRVVRVPDAGRAGRLWHGYEGQGRASCAPATA